MIGLSTMWNPLQSIKNSVTTIMLNGYFKQNISLTTMKAVVPEMLPSIFNSVKQGDCEHLSTIMTESCKQKVIKDWNSLSEEEKKKLTAHFCSQNGYFHVFQPKMRMKMPDNFNKTDKKELISYVNILFSCVHIQSKEVMEDGINPSNIKNEIERLSNYISMISIEMEKEVTLGSSGEWIIPSISGWPIRDR